MKLRAAILTLLLAASLIWFNLEQRSGMFHDAEEWFLDFLVSNAQDAFRKDVPEVSSDVVLVEFREEDKAEFSAWPPAPLDYIMVLRRLQEHEPEVVVITEPLHWEKAGAEFVAELRNTLVKFPSAVLGFELSTTKGGMSEDLAGFAANEMPFLTAGEGAGDLVPVFARVANASDRSLRIAAQAGFSFLSGQTGLSEEAVPVVARDGGRLVPSITAQAVTLFRHVPYAAQRLRFGTGARLSLGDQLIVPLNADGSFKVGPRPQVPRVNALELMTPDLGDETSKSVRGMLGRHKVMVLGGPAQGGRHAGAIAGMLAMPTISRASTVVEWGFAAAACLWCFWSLRHRRLKALATGLGAVVVGMAVCMIAFQSKLTWWSPLPALVAVAVGMAFALVWPHRAVSAATPVAVPPVA